ncbi:MAG: MFS transporter [Acidimicrobiales bacterium]
MTATLSAKQLLRTRSVAPFLLASAASTTATMIQITALGKQIYDMTGRDLDLGLLGLAEFVPALLLMTVTGSVADRFNRRHVASIGLIIEFVTTAMMAWYIATSPTATLPIFAIVIGFGVGRAFANPATRSMPPDIAPDGELPRLIAFHVGTWQAGAIIGPILAGFLFVVSPSAPFVACMVLTSGAAVLIQFARPRPDRVTPGSNLAREQDAMLVDLGNESRPAELLDSLGESNAEHIAHSSMQPSVTTPTKVKKRTFREAFEGFRVIRRNPALLGAISLDLFAVLFGGAVALLPAIAENRLGVGAVGLGWLRAAGGIGAALVTVLLSLKPIRRRTGPIMFISVAFFGIFTIVLGITQSFAVAFLSVMLLSAADSVSVFIRSTLVPLVTPSSARGRVMAVEGVFIGASNELGAFESGVAGQLLGTGRAVVFGGVATIGVVLAWIVLFPVLWRYDRFPDRPPD